MIDGEPGQARRDGMRRAAVAPVLERIARWPRYRERAISVCLGLERGMFWSLTARSILSRYHGVEIGSYSYGECFVPGALPAGTKVGRYVSIATGVRAFVRNHPMQRLSLHPFFYNPRLGIVPQDTISSGSLTIEHEAWIGANSIITPGCVRIGIGAVVGAGAVVTKDVPDFGIVAGNPARLLRKRFDDSTTAMLLACRWWERPISEVLPFLNDMLRPVGELDSGHPLLTPRP